MKYQLLPRLSDDDYAALEASIVAHGVLVPVEYDEDGNILDGHHRVEICESLGLVDWPRFVRKGLSETEKRTLARELNVSRRHLSSAQKRDLIADQLRDTPSISSRAIAAMLGVDDKTVASVRRRLIDAAEIPHHEEIEGRDGVRQPARKPIKTAFLPDTDNRRELMKVAKGLRAEDQKTRHAVRLAHMDMVAEKGASTAPGKVERLYPVVYADPPWRFPVWSEETGRNKSAENHYPTMPTEEICGLLAQLGGVAAKDAVLFLWATNPMLLDGLRVMQAWGFTYKSHWIWDKEVAGTGFWGRDRHELLLIGTRGAAVAPLPGTQPETVHREKKGRHSAKPEFFASTISQLYPGIAKIELFARAARPFWDVWGFEAAGDTVPAREPAGDAAADIGDKGGPAHHLPPAPGVSAPVEFHVGGMKKGSFARFSIHKTPDAKFAIAAEYELKGFCGGLSPATGSIATYADALRLALDELAGRLGSIAEDRSSECKDHHRAACRAALKWIEARRAEWGLSEPSSQERPA